MDIKDMEIGDHMMIASGRYAGAKVIIRAFRRDKYTDEVQVENEQLGLLWYFPHALTALYLSETGRFDTYGDDD